MHCSWKVGNGMLSIAPNCVCDCTLTHTHTQKPACMWWGTSIVEVTQVHLYMHLTVLRTYNLHIDGIWHIQCSKRFFFLPHHIIHCMRTAKFEFDAGWFYGNEHLAFLHSPLTCITARRSFLIEMYFNLTGATSVRSCVCMCDVDMEENCPMTLAFRFSSNNLRGIVCHQHNGNSTEKTKPKQTKTWTMGNRRTAFFDFPQPQRQ